MRSLPIALLLSIGIAAPCCAGSTAYGEGTRSCSQWADDGKTSQGYTSHLIWLGGYLTAYNSFASPSGSVAQYSSLDGAARWMDKFCDGHPLMLAGDAASKLIQALSPPRKRR